MGKIVWLIAAVALGGCGGGGGGGMASMTPPMVTAQSVGGIWKGQFTDEFGASVSGIAIVAEDGRFFFEAANPSNGCIEAATGTLSVSGASFSGSAQISLQSSSTTPTAQVACVFADNASSGSSNLSGTVAQRASLTLTENTKTANGLALAATTTTLAYDALYSQPSSLAAIAGNWTTASGLVISIAANGAIFAQDARTGCVVNGQVSLINSAYDAYAATATYSNCAGNLAIYNGVTANGLLAVDAAASPNRLYAGYTLKLPSGTTLILVGDATR